MKNFNAIIFSPFEEKNSKAVMKSEKSAIFEIILPIS